MNHTFEQEIHYRLLTLLGDEPQLRQLDMAAKMGISVGKVNFCLSELAKKGLIKVKRFKSAKNKLPYTYKLTPRGIEEKGRMTVRFLKRKLAEYEEIKRQIEALTLEVERHGLETPFESETDHPFSGRSPAHG
ncbi:MAG: MarR family EPS-associated transcriptional regulator [Deltaproteobacteria bacterium]|nr:MarR family EPS-associated transcriptional regulator [Deltaproteobacteria bacterium]